MEADIFNYKVKNGTPYKICEALTMVKNLRTSIYNIQLSIDGVKDSLDSMIELIDTQVPTSFASTA